MYNFPQFTHSTIWGEFASVGQLFSREVLWRGGNFSGVNFPRGQLSGGNCPGRNFPWEKLSSGETVRRDNYPWGSYPGDNFSRGQLSQKRSRPCLLICLIKLRRHTLLNFVVHIRLLRKRVSTWSS